MGGFKGAWQRKWQQEQIYKSWVTSRDEHNAVWMATLNTSRTVLTTKDNKKDDSYIAKLLLTMDFSCGWYAKRHKCMTRQDPGIERHKKEDDSHGGRFLTN